MSADRKLVLPVCPDCGTVQYPRGEVCRHCLGGPLEEQPVADSGVLLGWSRLHASLEPEFNERLPWTIASVRLDAGPTAIAHWVGGDSSVGQPVKVTAVDDFAGRRVLVARPADADVARVELLFASSVRTDADVASVAGCFASTARRFPQRAMLHVPEATGAVYGEAASDLTYAEMKQLTDNVAAAYGSAGVGAGDRIALMLENRPVFFTHFLTLNELGASVVPIYHELSADEIAYRLAHSESRLIVTLPEHCELAQRACREGGLSIPCVVAGEDLPVIGTERRAPDPSPRDEAAVLYTSGSTGTPKGCVLSNEYFLEMGRWYVGQGGFCEFSADGERLITPLPVSHMNALACSFMAMLVSGGCLVQLDRFHPSTWWQQVRESGATIVHYLGVMPAILLKLGPTADESVGDQVKFGFGAGVDPRHHGKFEDRFGFPLVEGWAMTETGSGACIAANREPRHVGQRCFGKPPPALEYRIVDDDGAGRKTGEPGELLVRAAGAEPRRGYFSGYLKDSAATDAAWDGGWFHTGDIVRQDAEGSMFFVDRIKNIVRRSGENIAAVEVEGALLELGEVATCAVAPILDEIRGEEVMALVVPAPGNAPGEGLATRLFEATRNTLAYFKLPGYIAFVDELPLTSSEKLQRGELKKICNGLLESGGVYDFRNRKRRERSAV